MKKQFRHGDLCIREIAEIPKDAKKLDTQTIAYGETTGHHHSFTKVKVSVYEGEKQRRFIEVPTRAPLTHQEHKTIEIDPGKYEVIHEQEYDYAENDMRQVMD